MLPVPSVPGTLKDKVRGTPDGPGVYFWKDESGGTLYIGKAKSLKKRLLSYFGTHPDFPKLAVLMSRARDVDYISTATEMDALLLEAQLVREHQPRYNKELKDDKSFPLLKITGEKFPRLVITRNKKEKKASYYGPFTDAKLLRRAVSLVQALFPIRKCQTLPKTACLYYHIGQCIAPCIKSEVETAYGKLVAEVKHFIGGGKKGFLDYLSDRMKQAAKELRFEDAQFYKNQIESLEKLRRKRFEPRSPERSVVLSATQELKQALDMESLPEKIVCFDISHTQGDETVASRTAFYRELPDKLGYRRYKIQTVKGINDYASIQEALGRMLRGIKEGREEWLPDLIMIDGGKGQLSAAKEILEKEEMMSIKLISIAKRFEWIYTTDSREPLVFPKGSPALHLLMRVRDEAHRFAISYHRQLKREGISKSELDAIPDIGDVRKKVLLKNFESLDELKRAGVSQLAGLPGMNFSAAEAVWSYFHT
ncbi:MAG TPA: excinuclease ABC subunit UvrC [Candidatus Omnitrophota bacterium]|nr:excinuclease ABC subunit C [Candidatus Omnitrophota bacterium]HRK61744.1 excinuclease ABC subunit UvrC [Candidatus Omnitrophota bacterium]